MNRIERAIAKARRNLPPGPGPRGLPALLPTPPANLDFHPAIVAEARNANGAILGYLVAPYGGTPGGALAAARKMQKAIEHTPEIDGSKTRIGATDREGFAQFVISRTGQIVPAGTAEARRILGVPN